MLDSRSARTLTEGYGDLMFLNAEIARKCFAPEIIPECSRRTT